LSISSSTVFILLLQVNIESNSTLTLRHTLVICLYNATVIARSIPMHIEMIKSMIKFFWVNVNWLEGRAVYTHAQVSIKK